MPPCPVATGFLKTICLVTLTPECERTPYIFFHYSWCARGAQGGEFKILLPSPAPAPPPSAP